MAIEPISAAAAAKVLASETSKVLASETAKTAKTAITETLKKFGKENLKELINTNNPAELNRIIHNEIGIKTTRFTVSKQNLIKLDILNNLKKYECKLPKDKISASRAIHKTEANKNLLKDINNNPILKLEFSTIQQGQINIGKTPQDLTWHHALKKGTLQLVDKEVHNGLLPHHGGYSEWGKIKN